MSRGSPCPGGAAGDGGVTRGGREGGGVLLGSGTPSLETLHEVREGRTRLFELPERIGARPLPPVELVDLRTAARVPQAGLIPWSETLDRAVAGAPARPAQGVLLPHPPRFPPVFPCPAPPAGH